MAEDFSDVCWIQTKVTGGGPHVWIDTGQGVTQGVDLGQPDLVNEVLLAIQVGGFNDIKVGNNQVTDAGTGQRNRNRRAKAADTGNADRGAFDRFVDAGSVPRRQQGVKFVGTGRAPLPLRDDEVSRLLGTEEAQADQAPKEDIPFLVGQAVEIIEGPFSDFNGTVEEVVPEKGKVKVSVSLFGRPTTVELDYLQLRGH